MTMKSKYDALLGEMREEDSLTPSQAERLDSIHPILTSSALQLAVNPGEFWKWTVAADADASISFNASGLSGKCAWATVDILLGADASVVGSGVTLVDELAASAVNRCVMCWDGESTRLYVVETLEAANE